MTAHLFDHEALDGSNFLPARIVNGGALDVIALDQRMAHVSRGSVCFRHGSSPPVLDPTALVVVRVRGTKRCAVGLRFPLTQGWTACTRAQCNASPRVVGMQSAAVQ